MANRFQHAVWIKKTCDIWQSGHVIKPVNNNVAFKLDLGNKRNRKCTGNFQKF